MSISHSMSFSAILKSYDILLESGVTVTPPTFNIFWSVTMSFFPPLDKWKRHPNEDLFFRPHFPVKWPVAAGMSMDASEYCPPSLVSEFIIRRTRDGYCPKIVNEDRTEHDPTPGRLYPTSEQAYQVFVSYVALQIAKDVVEYAESQIRHLGFRLVNKSLVPTEEG